MTEEGMWIPGEPIKDGHRINGYIMCIQMMDKNGKLYYGARSFNTDPIVKIGMAEFLRTIYGAEMDELPDYIAPEDEDNDGSV